jgi:hypothetical protein
MGFKIKTSEECGRFLEQNWAKLKCRNKAVLGRVALFAALKNRLPSNFTVSDSNGIELAEDTILGDELPLLVRASLNFLEGKTLTEEEYRVYFKRYFEYGCTILRKMWDECKGDHNFFIQAILKECSFESISPEELLSDYSEGISKITKPVYLQILEDKSPWIINEAGANGLVVISGQPGSGKSQLALDMLCQLARQGVRILFFDLKGELEADPTNQYQTENREEFFSITKARYTQLITSGLPINPLFKANDDTENAKIASEIAFLIRSFAHQLGANQEMLIRDAYDSLSTPDFSTLEKELQKQKDKAGVVLSIINKIVRFNIFSNHKNAIPIQEWLSQSHVIDFKLLGNDNETKVLSVALILNAIMRVLSHNLPVQSNIQPLQLVIFVDEAHLILPREGKVGLLGSLARQGRSWGIPVWLASQDADAFFTSGANATDFSELATCGIHFSPHNLTENKQRQILGQLINRSLKKGEAVVRIGRETQIGTVRQFWKFKGQVILDD